MKLYSQGDVSRILKIERPRLQEWLRLQFVYPSYASPGPGSKALFSIDDLYSIQLFIELLDTGFNRVDAAFVVRKLRGSVKLRSWSVSRSACNWEEDFLNILKGPSFKDDDKPTAERFVVDYGEPRIQQYFVTRRETLNKMPYWHLIIRLKEIKERVDCQLS